MHNLTILGTSMDWFFYMPLIFTVKGTSKRSLIAQAFNLVKPNMFDEILAFRSKLTDMYLMSNA